MYLMVIVLNVLIFNMFYLYQYYYVNIHPIIVYLFIIIIFAKQTNQVSLVIMGFLFSLSKGATTSFKPIYKCS